MAVVSIAALGAAMTGSAQAQTLPSAPGPVAQPAGTVTDVALPTVQVDGIVWSQAVVGNTVYAGGSFANARPAGAASGTDLTTRNNLLSYNLTTGALNTSFAPSLNGQVKAVTASPDGSRIYVGGSFTTANGVNRYRIAAYSTNTGALISSFAPTLNATVQTITATNTTVYVGGGFGTANGNSRVRLAAFSASNGALLDWAPTADNLVNAMVLTPDGSKVIIGGSFATINGQTVQGLAALDSSSAAVLPWAANTVVHDYGSQSAILSLSTDGTAIYGTGYVTESGTGNLEGSFSADPSTGQLNWLESCHGDSYGIYGAPDTVYVVGHPYDCSSVGGYPYSSAAGGPYHRAIAFTPAATGSNAGGNFDGQPSPSMVNWFPNLTPGTVTGTTQAAWSVTGGSGYTVLGGEFTAVNGTSQQGLVRFASRAVAPDTAGPQLSGSNYPITATSTNGGSPVITWTANWDPDDVNLTYKVVRDGAAKKPIYTSPPVSATFWDYSSVPAMSFTDSTVHQGTHTYRVYATDPAGNTTSSPVVSVTVPNTVLGSKTPTVGAINGGFPVTLGMKVTPSVAGSLTGVRFWKGDGNTGTHTVSVWSTDGTRLATATVSSETASGWQSASFATPVAVTAGTTYIVSYLCPIGHYAEDDHYFDKRVTNGPLSAPVGAGVYAGGDNFPANTYANANYWVDPLFTRSG